MAFVKCRPKKVNQSGNDPSSQTEPTSLVTVDATDSRLVADSNEYTYKYVITLSGSDYIYMSNYPFYAESGNDQTYLCMASDAKRHKTTQSSLGNPTTTAIGTIDGVSYGAETTGRDTVAMASIVSNYPIVDISNVM